MVRSTTFVVVGTGVVVKASVVVRAAVVVVAAVVVGVDTPAVVVSATSVKTCAVVEHGYAEQIS